MSRVNYTQLVNGECEIALANPNGQSINYLGYSLDGVVAEFQGFNEDVYADTGGPRVPVDVQEFGEVAILRFQLVIWDETLLGKLRTRADATNQGLLGTTGKLLGANGLFWRMLLTSPSAALPFNFPTCYPLDAKQVKLGTKRSGWDIAMRAIPYIGVGPAKGKTLWNRNANANAANGGAT